MQAKRFHDCWKICWWRRFFSNFVSTSLRNSIKTNWNSCKISRNSSLILSFDFVCKSFEETELSFRNGGINEVVDSSFSEFLKLFEPLLVPPIIFKTNPGGGLVAFLAYCRNSKISQNNLAKINYQNYFSKFSCVLDLTKFSLVMIWLKLV